MLPGRHRICIALSGKCDNHLRTLAAAGSGTRGRDIKGGHDTELLALSDERVRCMSAPTPRFRSTATSVASAAFRAENCRLSDILDSVMRRSNPY
jgi:hypothetical protein